MTFSFPSRVYPILDTGALRLRGLEAESVARAWLDGGARLLQYRHKSAWRRETAEELERIAQLCREFQAQLIVNDRADFAVIAGTGLHVGQDDLSPSDARRLIGARLLGLSTHTTEQLRMADAEPADYLALGPIFSTTSKANPDSDVGLANLAAWRRLTRKPLVAIGGITAETAPAVLASGADCVAVIGALLPESNDLTGIRARMEEWIKLTK